MKLAIFIVLFIVKGIVLGFAVNSINKVKNNDRNWFWWGFFFGLITLIVIYVSSPNNNRNLNTNKSITTYDEHILLSDDWKCTCGRTNPSYTSDCVCGAKKRDITIESLSLNESRITSSNGDWKCSCGRINPTYTYSCMCGVNKQALLFNNTTLPSAPSQTATLYPQSYIRSKEFERRLARARSENMYISEFLNESHTSARIKNKVFQENSWKTEDHEYVVSDTCCECEDYKKRLQPCKHMIFLRLENQEYSLLEKKYTNLEKKQWERMHQGVIPYWKLCDDSIYHHGYTKEYRFNVTGREHGFSEKTGRPTNHWATIQVIAKNTFEAQIKAGEMGIQPPYRNVTRYDQPATERQVDYMHNLGIPFPNILSKTDASVLLTRFLNEDNSIANKGSIAIANQLGIEYSIFSSQKEIVSRIWNALSNTPEQRLSFFCYYVYCNERKLEIGEPFIAYNDPCFQGLVLSSREALLLNEFNEFGYECNYINKRRAAYVKAKELTSYMP